MKGRIVRFALICEGDSDKALVEHLQVLLIHCGAVEAVGVAVSQSSIRSLRNGSTSAIGDKVRAFLSFDSEYDLLFIHRDTDNMNYESRFAEIESGMAGVQPTSFWIPAIPVRETEAWLLLDEAAIRRAAGNPRGRAPLELPKPARIEDVANPKEVLRTALSTASGQQGGRLRRFKKKFSQQRRSLLEQLPVGGYLEQVPAWCRLKQAVEDFVSAPAE